MGSVNKRKKSNSVLTHEGAPAIRYSPSNTLRRLVLSCLLWEDNYYVDGESVGSSILEAALKVEPTEIMDLAIEARNDFNLRHVPLLLALSMMDRPQTKRYTAMALAEVIQRPDELSEALAIWFKLHPKDGEKKTVPNQIKKGLAKAFAKFNEYSLSKYKGKGKEYSLKDVMRLTHPKPENKEQTELWKKLVDGKLKAPDTWEVALSSGEDKKQIWERLLSENKLGGMAFIRNLRNMDDVKVDKNSIRNYLPKDLGKVIPYRYIAASKHAPWAEPLLERLMLKGIENSGKSLEGHTVLMVDVSGSMTWPLSGFSEMNRIDAACGLSIILREMCESIDVFSFSGHAQLIPPRHGFALRDAIVTSQLNVGTWLGRSVDEIYEKYEDREGYRLIVITDEQAHDVVKFRKREGKDYVINCAPYQNGIAYGDVVKINGFSEGVIDFMIEHERMISDDVLL